MPFVFAFLSVIPEGNLLLTAKAVLSAAKARVETLTYQSCL
jgi:hypothetical protein